MSVFLATNKRLPCPASPIVAKNISPNYGNEGTPVGSCNTSGGYVSTSNPNIVYGMVPIRELGLSSEMAEDGFESKFGYIIDKNFTDASIFGAATATDNIIIKNKSGGSLQTITSDAIFAIISYGSNKSGAYDHNTSSITSQNSRSADIDELENDINGSDVYAFDNIIISNSLDSDIFDDLVLYKTRTDIVSESKDMTLIKCLAISAATTDISYGGFPIEWADGVYDQIAIATTPCPEDYKSTVSYPTRRCGAFGVWEKIIHACTD